MTARLRLILATYRQTVAAALATITPAAVVAVLDLIGVNVPYGWAVIASAILAPLGVALAANAPTPGPTAAELSAPGATLRADN
ncbi:hypothetical protein [Amycolatopsis sp. CA-230715]|uniref:hypothetical protein n=1 Tax=Amycolatopsis sp. CA-230715 TaxID=2745196 RepID=UPI001C00DFA6|nr:hypothetical protein [Amycolatopsis sp. CA-230715]QWF81125.1 hypothetical protein HUW46_04551 [Amycolatopsis sp. CA-230715]